MQRGGMEHGEAEAHNGYWLVIDGLGSRSWCHRITERLQRVGRSRTGDIILVHPSVSRTHAEIWRRGSQAFIRDLSSRNGVLVNGRRITESAVAVGDRIQVGTVVLRVVESLDEGSETVFIPSIRPESALGKAIAGLSKAENRVFVLLLQGLSQKEVAKRLGISRNTVHIHVDKIYRAFGVHSHPELVARFGSEAGERSVA